jgi:hypothetical protein
MPLTADLMCMAAYNADWRMLQYLRSEGLDWNAEACATAADRGHLTLLKQLREHGCPWDADRIGPLAAYSGSVPLLQWLQEQGIVFTATAVISAASKGYTAAVEHLRFAAQCDWSTDVCMAAAFTGQLDTLQWLREHGCPCEHRRVCTAAAHGGSVEVMAYMLQQQQLDAAAHTALLTEMLNFAGINGKLAAAQWLHAQGAAWPAVLHFAARPQQQWSGAVLEWSRVAVCTSPL